MLNLPVCDIMNDHPIKIKADVPIRDLAHLLLRYRISGILVVEPHDENALLGVFTTTDFLNLMDVAISGGSKKMLALKSLGSRPVSEFVNRKFLCLQHKDSTAKAVGLMRKNNTLTVPVFDGEKLVGVLGRHDIINIAFA